MPRVAIGPGFSFGRLTVLARYTSKTKRPFYICKCSCFNFHIVRGDNVRSGRTYSCGCFLQEKIKTHGQSKSKEYRSWNQMKNRCLNKSDKDYKNYGARGIGIDSSWADSFSEFLKDVGAAPSTKYSIDRINNNIGYYPGNIRWATAKEQANNRRNNHYIEINGETLTPSEIADKYNLNWNIVYKRYRAGKTGFDLIKKVGF